LKKLLKFQQKYKNNKTAIVSEGNHLIYALVNSLNSLDWKNSDITN